LLAGRGFAPYACSNEAEACCGFGETQFDLSMAKDPYVALRVERDASPEQIQAAYKHWAKEIQPSKDSPPGEEMHELQEAYTVVGHPERRRAYDRIQRAEPLRAQQETEAAPATREIHLQESFETFHPSFEQLFDRFWSNFDEMTRPKAERVESLTLEVPVTPEEARAGGRARVLIPARAQCPACFGHGAVGFYQCWHCGGQGSITADYPVEISYPAGLLTEYNVRVPLEQFGIRNFYLTVRFRVSAMQ
jgi:molecular chaperone DnaJ